MEDWVKNLLANQQNSSQNSAMPNDYLQGTNAAQFEQLAAQGLITPETYERVKAQVVPMSPMTAEPTQTPAPEIQAEEPPTLQAPTTQSMTSTPWMQPFSKEGITQRAAEAAQAGDFNEADRLSAEVEKQDIAEQQKADEAKQEQIAKYESDLAKAQAYNERAQKMGLQQVQLPSSEAYGIQKEDMPATEQDRKLAEVPTISEVEAAAEPVRHEAAKQVAAVREQDKQVKNAVDREQDLRSKLDALDKEAQSATPSDESNELGDRLRLAFAVALGSFAKGENPALKMLEQRQKSIQENKKLSQEQKLAREKREFDLAQFELKKLDSVTDSAYKKAQIAKLNAEVQEKINEANAKLTAELRGKQGYSNEEINSLDEDSRNRLVSTPDGKYRLATNKKFAENLTDYNGEVEPALASVQRIRDLAKDYKLVQKLNPLDPQRRQIETEMVALVGNLRLPFTGPGQLLEKEYERLRNAIGNPSKILTTDEVTDAALSTVANKLRSDQRIKYKQAGIDIPLSREEKEIELLQKRNPGISRTKIEQFYNKRK